MTPAARHKREILAAGKWLRLVSEDGWEYVERVRISRIVVIVAVTPAGELILTEQFRPAVAARVIDLPAGLVGDAKASRNESLVAAARRELIEETGYDADRFELLAHAPTSPGLTSETVSFMRAIGLKRVGSGGGVDGENIETHLVKRDQAAAWLDSRLRARRQVDCKVYAGLYFASIASHRLKARRR